MKTTKTKILLLLIAFFAIITNGCEKDVFRIEDEALSEGNSLHKLKNTGSLQIGQHYKDGIVAYFFQPGDQGYDPNNPNKKGILISINDISTGIQWYNGTYKFTGATYPYIHGGDANTSQIVNSQGTGSYAAKLCYDYVTPNNQFWYLPNASEFSAIWHNRAAINGGFTNGLYWTSYESPTYNYHASAFNFTNNTEEGNHLKNETLRVRAISYFYQGYNFPTVDGTVTIFAITENSANCGYNVTLDGGTALTARGICWSTNPNPTINLPTKTNDGTGTGSFITTMTGLIGGTTYYVRAYATNIEGTTYSNEATFTTLPLTVTDYDGNVYQTIKIGDQTWMLENLKTTKYRDGTSIDYPVNASAWAANITGAYCFYNDIISYLDEYGAFYNWYAVNNAHGLAPAGWHIPTDAEWKILENNLGGAAIAGGKMKQAGTTNWYTPNEGATNSSGFTAIPTSYRSATGTYSTGAYRKGAYWWSVPQSTTTNAWYHGVNYSSDDAVRYSFNKKTGFSVRCIKD